MKYDFTTILDRKGKDSIAVEPFEADWIKWPGKTKEGFDIIPMWVADMNFPAVHTIPEAIIERTKHTPREEYFDAIIKWHKTRNGIEGLEPKHIGYENGVLGGVVSALNVLCSKGDSVLLHSPTYIGFTKSLTNNGYHIVHSPLVKDENNVYRMDFEDMEKKIVKNRIHAAVFCSPHNPCGRVWERWELEKAMEVYRANDCLVISDEIWSDIILNGHKHIPTQSVSEDARSRTVALYAPSKTFNLAGLVGSYHIIYNPYLRDRVRAKSSKPHYNDMNVLSMHALIGAYKPEGYEWVEELRETISGNVNFACDYITQHFEITLKNNGLKKIRFHDLRHSCASLLYANGVSLKEIQEWLGHSDLGTTSNIYTHLDYSSKVSSANAILAFYPENTGVQTIGQ